MGCMYYHSQNSQIILAQLTISSAMESLLGEMGHLSCQPLARLVAHRDEDAGETLSK